MPNLARMKASGKPRRKIHQMRAGWRSRGRQGKRETMTSLWKRTTSLALFSKKPLKRNQRWWLTGAIQSKPMTLCQKKRQGIEFHPGTCQCSHHLLCEHQGETAGSGEGCHHPAHTCWTRVGPGGKADWCSWLGAHAIFDDCNEIIQEGVPWQWDHGTCNLHQVDPAQQYTRSCWRKSSVALEKATGSTLLKSFGKGSPPWKKALGKATNKCMGMALEKAITVIQSFAQAWLAQNGQVMINY